MWLMRYKIDVKYQYASQAVCAYALIFLKRAKCALIGACVLIRIQNYGNLEFPSKALLSHVHWIFLCPISPNNKLNL